MIQNNVDILPTINEISHANRIYFNTIRNISYNDEATLMAILKTKKIGRKSLGVISNRVACNSILLLIKSGDPMNLIIDDGNLTLDEIDILDKPWIYIKIYNPPVGIINLCSWCKNILPKHYFCCFFVWLVNGNN